MAEVSEFQQSEESPNTLKAHYLDLFARNRAAILEAADLGFEPPIKGCPGWDVAALTAHMGRVYTFWLKWVGERPRGHSSEAWKEIMADRDARLPGFSAWDRAGYPRESRPDGIIPFTRRTGEELHAMLVDLRPDDIVWTFVPLRQNGAFVFRRLAMETTIHLWDAQNAHGVERPIDQALARDGIDEMLMMLREDPAYEEKGEYRHGQTILLREEPDPSDPAQTGLRWLVSFEKTGITISPEEGRADATVSGTASDLWLYIMGRRAIDEMPVEGDTALAASWGDLAGRF